MILAPLRGVTIRTFREVFAEPIRLAGFTEAITPFIPAMAGTDPLKDRELRPQAPTARPSTFNLKLTPQFIGKDPAALRNCLKRVRAAGYATADLNCGCPFPMVRNKGRGSGILRTPEILRRMLEVGCEEMGPGQFSVKTRLGIERNDELLALMPILNEFPLRHLTVHARNARQMYSGKCDAAAFAQIVKVAKMPVVCNGDIACPPPVVSPLVMVGRSFIRSLGSRPDAGEWVRRYVAASRAELSGDHAVLGRLKELLSYWRELPSWHRRWSVIKLCRTTDELLSMV